jgi:signal peptidase I
MAETTPSTETNPVDPPPPPAGPLRRLWRNWIKPIGLAILIVFGFRSTFYDWNDVPSASMEPTILVGDRIFVNKLAYDLKVPFSSLIWRAPLRIAWWGDPERGDVVVFFAPQDGRRMVKRVVGLPGDTIELRDNVLFINGAQIKNDAVNEGRYSRLDLDPRRTTDASGNAVPIEPELPPNAADYAAETIGDVRHPLMFLHRRAPGYSTWGPTTIPDGQYLMMGDNRNNSRDSRDPSLGFIPRKYIVGKAFGVAFSFDKVPSFSIRWERFFRALDHEKVAP